VTHIAGHDYPVALTLRLVRGRLGILFVAIAAASVLADTSAARADRLPTPAECAAGTAAPITLGETKGAVTACAGPLYVGGNPIYPCGTILAGDTAVTGTPQDDPAANCDGVDPFDDAVPYRVALPPEYATQSQRRWPVIYLLPGGGGYETDWEDFTSVVPALTRAGAIVVVPYAGLTFHTNWEIGERREYERTFVEDLIPHIDASFRTMADRAHRAIGGFSRGGYGAMLTAARHPDLFGAAGSMSGAVDPLGELREQQLYLTPLSSLGSYDELLVDPPWYGSPVTNELGWRERSPIDLARALRGVDLWMSSGDGTPDADDPVDPFTPVSALPELFVMRATAHLDKTLTALGIPHFYDVHQGVHDYVNAGADVLRWAAHLRSGGFGRPVLPSFDLRNADPSFGAYGWTFIADRRRAAEFLDITRASRTGVTLTGSGRTLVTTPALFGPTQQVKVRIGGVVRSRRANAAGQLRFAVDLGRPHQRQQFTVRATAARQTMVTTVVRFLP
jgi:S-formylglutathione hydrolase FrmB